MAGRMANRVILANKVSFIAPRAQFTPQEVEICTEHEKPMFRLKVQLDTDYLMKP
jgi:HlyD family secretion protein